MKTDIVQRQCPHHVPAAALFQHAGFFPDDFEGGANTEAGQIARDTQGSVVRRRLDVVLRIEPEHHVYRRGGV